MSAMVFTVFSLYISCYLLLSCAQTTPPICPQKCSCNGEYVTCRDIDDIPTNLPEATQILNIIGLKGDLRKDRLRGLQNLSSIKLERADGIRIRSCAFGGLKRIKSILISISYISVIERNAFTNLNDVFNIQFVKCEIGIIDSLAFSNLTLCSVRLEKNIIGELKSKAFHVSNSNSFVIAGNKFDIIRCHSLDTLDQNQNIRNNNFTCGCDIIWAINETSMWSKLQSSNSFCGSLSSVRLRKSRFSVDIQTKLELFCSGTPSSCDLAANVDTSLFCLNDSSATNSTVPPKDTCPMGCVCTKIFAICTNTIGIPLDLPSSISELTLKGVRGKLDAGRLRHIHNLNYMKIEDGVNLVFKSCLTDSITGLATLIVHNSKILTIEKNAFSNINDVVDLRIRHCSISVLETMAFNNVTNSNIEIVSNTIDVVNAKTFYLCRQNKYKIVENNFKIVNCDSFNIIADSADFTFLSNVFECSCDIAWMKLERTAFWSKIQYGNKCTFGIQLAVFSGALSFCSKYSNNCELAQTVTVFSPVCSFARSTTYAPGITNHSSTSPSEERNSTRIHTLSSDNPGTRSTTSTTLKKETTNVTLATGLTTKSGTIQTTNYLNTTKAIPSETTSKTATKTARSTAKTSTLPMSQTTTHPVICPTKCTCVADTVTCKDVTEIPSNLPSTTKSLNIIGLNGDMTRDRLLHLRNLVSIKLEGAKAIVIRSCAFGNLKHVKSLQIISSRISKIERNAFTNLDSVYNIQLSKCEIGTLDTLSFSNVTLSSIRITDNIIGEINPYAFFSTDSTSFLITGNKFDVLRCHTLDVLDSNHVNIRNNNFTCNCDILWSIKENNFWFKLEYAVSYCGQHSSVLYRKLRFSANVKTLLASTCTGAPRSCSEANTVDTSLVCLSDTAGSGSTLTTLPPEPCPTGCVCAKTFVSCTNTDGIPRNIPSSTTELIFTGIRGYLNAGRLQYMNGLRYIKIQDGIDLTFKACSFDAIVRLGTLHVQNSKIQKIEENAFGNMYDIRDFRIQNCRIEVLESMSFNNVSNSVLSIIDNNINEIRPNAFYLSNNNRYVIKQNELKMVNCDSLNIIANSTSFTFKSNKFVCSCEIAWMNKERNEFWQKIKYENQCTFGISLAFYGAVSFCKNYLNNCSDVSAVKINSSFCVDAFLTTRAPINHTESTGKTTNYTTEIPVYNTSKTTGAISTEQSTHRITVTSSIATRKTTTKNTNITFKTSVIETTTDGRGTIYFTTANVTNTTSSAQGYSISMLLFYVQIFSVLYITLHTTVTSRRHN